MLRKKEGVSEDGREKKKRGSTFAPTVVLDEEVVEHGVVSEA